MQRRALSLLEAAASLAQDEYIDLDAQQLLGMCTSCWPGFAALLARRCARVLQRLRMLNQFLY